MSRLAPFFTSDLTSVDIPAVASAGVDSPFPTSDPVVLGMYTSFVSSATELQPVKVSGAFPVNIQAAPVGKEYRLTTQQGGRPTNQFAYVVGSRDRIQVRIGCAKRCA